MKENLIGQTFGLLTVIDEAEPYRNPHTGEIECARWLCRCVCGNTKVVTTAQLKFRNNRYGCGCKGVDNRIKWIDELGCYEYTTFQGDTFLFDECDLELAKSSTWNVDTTNGYVRSNMYGYFHRCAMGIDDPNIQVDHKNGNHTDNRRQNFRVTDNQHNCWNSVTPSHNTSGHKNVSRSHDNGWRVRIVKDGLVHSWYTDDYDEACRLAEEKHKELFGEYSVYNREEVI